MPALFPRLRIVLRELRHVSLHLQGRQRAAQLVGGIGRKAALAGHHLTGTCEEVIQRVEQGAHFRGHTLKHKRIGRIRRAGVQGLRQLLSGLSSRLRRRTSKAASPAAPPAVA